MSDPDPAQQVSKVSGTATPRAAGTLSGEQPRTMPPGRSGSPSSAGLEVGMRVVLGVIIASAAVFLRWLLEPLLLSGAPFAFLYPALILLAIWGGLLPTAACAVVGIVATLYVVEPPVSDSWLTTAGILSLVTNVTLGVMLVAVAGVWEQWRRRVERSTRIATAARADLDASRRLLQATQRLASAGDWGFTPPGTWAISSEAAGLFNCPVGTQDPLIRLSPTDQDRVTLAIDRALRGEQAINIEFRVESLEPGGPSNWIAMMAGRSIGEAGPEVRGLLVDVTERRNANDASARAFAEYRNLFELAGDAIVIFEPRDEVVLDANQRACEMYGVSRSKLMGASLRQFEAGQRSQLVERVVRQGRCENVEVVHCRADGLEMILAVNAATVQFHGRTAVLAILRDETARREADKELRETRERLRLALSSSYTGTFTVDFVQGLADWDDNMYRLFGRDSHQPVKTKQEFFECILAEDRDAFLKAVSAVGSTESEFDLTFRVGLCDENVRWNRCQGTLYRNADGVPVSMAGVCTDIDEQKRAQEKLATAVDDLNRINAELEEYAFIASHDLREPLRGMRSYAAFIVEDVGPTLDAEALRKLSVIERLGERMDRLISALLQLTRLGQTKLEIEEVDLHEVALKVAADPAFAQPDIAVEIVGHLPKLLCDRARMGQVIRELVLNAVTFNRSPVRRVEVGCEAVQVENGGKSVTLYVRDNGIGIPDRHTQAVFRLFKRLHARDEFGGGIGAGLAFVKKIVQMHHGRVWIEPGRPSGTTVRLSLGGVTNAARPSDSHHRGQ